jgi:hypothetical protein
MPHVQRGENMTQEMAPILKPALVGSTAGNLVKAFGWSATGRGKLQNSSKERTGDNRLILTDPCPCSQGVDKA